MIVRICKCGRKYQGLGGCPLCKKADNQRRCRKSVAHGIAGKKRKWWMEVMRPAVLQRAGYQCEWVEEGHRCEGRATTADYIPGGVHSDRLDDYKAYCQYHHGVKDGGRAYVG